MKTVRTRKTIDATAPALKLVQPEPPQGDSIQAWSDYLDKAVGELAPEPQWWEYPELWDTRHEIDYFLAGGAAYTKVVEEVIGNGFSYDLDDLDGLSVKEIRDGNEVYVGTIGEGLPIESARLAKQELDFKAQEKRVFRNIRIQAIDKNYERTPDGVCYRPVWVLRGHAEVTYKESLGYMAAHLPMAA